MSDTLVDSNVLIDIFSDDPDWQPWSRGHLAEARRAGALVINPIVYAEVAVGMLRQQSLESALRPSLYRHEDLPWEAAFAAGRAFLAYRRRGGLKRSPLPGFYIGAHADFRGYVLLTRDPARYRWYFPSLRMVSPESDP